MQDAVGRLLRATDADVLRTRELDLWALVSTIIQLSSQLEARNRKTTSHTPHSYHSKDAKNAFTFVVKDRKYEART